MENNQARVEMIESLDKVIDRSWKLLNGQNTDSGKLLEVILRTIEMKAKVLGLFNE